MSNPLIPLTLLSSLMATAAVAAPLNIQVYNPGEQAVFPVSSELVTGDKEALLVDDGLAIGAKVATGEMKW